MDSARRRPLALLPLLLSLLGCAAPASLAGGSALDLRDALSAQVSYVALAGNGNLLGEAGLRPDSLQEIFRFPPLSVVVVTGGRVSTASPETFLRDVGPIDTPTRAILRAWMSDPINLLLRWADGEATAEVLGGGALVLVQTQATPCRANGEALLQIFRLLLFVSSDGDVSERGRSLVDERVVARGCRDAP